MKIGHQKACQDSTCPPSLFLGSWRMWRFLTHLVMVSDGREHSREASLKVSWRLDIRNLVKTPPVLQVSPWSLGGYGGSWKTWKQQKPCQGSTCPPSLFLEAWRMWRFLMNLEVVSYDRDHTSEAFVKVSSRSNIRNPVKTSTVLQVTSWSLGGHWDSWWSWSWCQMIRNIIQKLMWKFHLDPTSQTLSRLHLSSKYPPG